MTANTNDHTPGPWTIDNKIDLSHGASCLIRAGNTGIAEVWKTDDNIPMISQDQTGNANARLIAAAPDLLYELEQACLSLDELAKEYVEGIGHNATARGVREQTRRARAAIEKARKEG